MPKRSSQLEREKRITEIAERMITKGLTIRQAAEEYGVSKSTVHKDLKRVLPNLDSGLHVQVLHQLSQNLDTRTLKSAESTRKLWEERKKNGPNSKKH